MSKPPSQQELKHQSNHLNSPSNPMTLERRRNQKPSYQDSRKSGQQPLRQSRYTKFQNLHSNGLKLLIQQDNKDDINNQESKKIIKTQYHSSSRDQSKEQSRDTEKNYQKFNKPSSFDSHSSPFYSPVYQQQKPRRNNNPQVYFGYQEYEFINKKNRQEYTTVYYFKVINIRDPNKDYYHEITTQNCQKKFYFSIVLKKLIGFLNKSSRNKNYDIYCNSIYLKHLNQVTKINDCNQPQCNSQQRPLGNLQEKYKSSQLKFNIIETDQQTIQNMYLEQKEFPCNLSSSVRISKEDSGLETESFLNTNKYYNYLDKEIFELHKSRNNFKQENDILQYKGQIIYQQQEEQESSENQEDGQEIIPYFDSQNEIQQSCSQSYSRSRSRSYSQPIDY